ncbi:oxygenase MpaB family protein [Nocardia sp. NPDC056000]|uniref:oxygenase MpaB family protein n=1 Tax=Nocardia sp. NPDC056000 TaxID=3345674 RepID=UPI0035D84D07
MNASISEIPARHPAAPRKIAGLDLISARLGVCAPSADEWATLGADLLVGDEPMDRLLDWMAEVGLERTRPMFDRAVRLGIDQVPEAPEPLREFFARIEQEPEWVDHDMLRRGAWVYRSGGVDGVYLARDVAFLGGYLASGFNRTLLRTGALERGPARRFAETLQWALDVTSENGMHERGPGYRSTIHVRLIHSFVRRHVAAMPDWETREWGIPINQTDMAATLVGSLMVPVLVGMAMGIVPRRADLEAAAHLTRYVGWLMGVQDDLLPKSFQDSVRILRLTLAAITNPDETSSRLARPLADDPLAWHYRRLAPQRRKLARAQHLSLASTFLGARAMRHLGLPGRATPWYPLMRLPVNIARSATTRMIPGSAEYFAARGRRAQEGFLRTLVGSEPAVIGGSVSHHPA